MKNESQKPALYLKNAVWALFLLLIVSLGYMQPFSYLGGRQLTPTDLLFLPLAILWVIALLLGQLKFRWHKFYWVLGGYFAAMLISAIFSADAKASFIKLAGEAYLIGLAVIAFNLIDDERDLKYTLRAWLCGAALPVTAGILSIFLFYFQPANSILGYTLYNYGSVPIGNYPRLSSTFVTASMFCNYLNVCLLMLFIAAKSGWIGKETVGKALSRMSFIAILVCSVFTISAGLGGLFLALGGWAWLTLRRSKPLVARVAIAGGAAMAGVFLALNFVALQNQDDAPYTYNLAGVKLQPSPRLLVWTDALKTFAEDPITGKGIGQPVTNVVFQKTDKSFSLLTDAHNIFLNVAAQNGLIGLFAILALAAYLLRLANRSFTVQRDNSFVLKGLGLAFLSAFVYQGLTGSFEDARHLWVLIGMIPACRVVSKI